MQASELVLDIDQVKPISVDPPISVVGGAMAEVLRLVDPVDPAEVGVKIADSVDPISSKRQMN